MSHINQIDPEKNGGTKTNVNTTLYLLPVKNGGNWRKESLVAVVSSTRLVAHPSKLQSICRNMSQFIKDEYSIMER